MVRKYRKAKGIVEAGVSSTYMQLRSRRIVYVRSEKSSSVSVVGDNGVSSSCSGSNEYKKKELIHLEEEDKDGDTETSTYRRGTKRKLFENLREEEKEELSKSMENYSSEFESAVKESLDCCCSGRKTMEETVTAEEEEKAKLMTEMPTESEIEDFFVEAEKQLKEKFKKKYNFDFEKEKPLEGRYEWVKLQ
ncbi:Cyclin-dependent kinase inhibitor [Arabidopsis suecica]|uniref:Cyclin-dependent kinase inhibitor n=1 Tax=Arabidopsis suecica TaxID=45249 RepID=A0A8T2FZI9_ARASU|nr:cyclin-dependent kinase inhibitor protein [Arabidopsis thaliana]KAG7641795.1 Cyclin-dependent kinase inhibitor [Arabidopsis suecica]